MTLSLVCAGNPGEGVKAIEPLRKIGTPVAEVVRPTPYVALQSMLDGGAPDGRHYYWKAHRLPTLTDDVIDIFLDRMGSATSPLAQINGWAVGGAVSRVAGDATAVGDRHEGFEMSITVGWPAPDANPDQHKGWVRDGGAWKLTASGEPGTRIHTPRRHGRCARRLPRRRCRPGRRSPRRRTRFLRGVFASPHGAARRQFNRSTG